MSTTDMDPRTDELMEGTRVATGFGVCGACGKRLSVHQSIRGAERYYRCNNQLCGQRYRNRIRESLIIKACCNGARQSMEDLAAAAAAEVVSDREPEQITKLRGEIADAKQLNNPRMAPVIAAMELELQAELRKLQLRQGGGSDADQLQQALMEVMGEPGALERATPEEQLSIFLSLIEAVVVDQGVITEVRTA